MRYFRIVSRVALALGLMTLNLAMSACSGLSTPLDQAYYTGGNAFSMPGGYNRTIFSSSNF